MVPIEHLKIWEPDRSPCWAGVVLTCSSSLFVDVDVHDISRFGFISKTRASTAASNKSLSGGYQAIGPLIIISAITHPRIIVCGQYA